MSLASNFETFTPNLLGVPILVRLRILGHVLIRDDEICPYYNAGSGEIPSSRRDEYIPNFDVSILRVSKQMYGEASAVLYTGNNFTFSNPQVATWWMKRIRKNVGYLWALKFELNSGIDPYALFATWEVHWSYIFSWMLKNTTNLKDLYVSFDQWKDLEQDHEHLELRANWVLLRSALRCRENVIRSLASIRGLHLVTIVPGQFLSLEEYREMRHLMRLPKEGNAQPQMALNEVAKIMIEERKAVDQAVMDDNMSEEDSESGTETETIVTPDAMNTDDYTDDYTYPDDHTDDYTDDYR